MRGHGAVDVRHAFEALLDEAGASLGIDPFALRRANLITAPYRTLNDLQVNSCGLPQALDAVWEEEQVKFFADRGCNDSEISAHQRRFAGAVAPQYLNISNGGRH